MTVGPAASAKRIATPAQLTALVNARNARGKKALHAKDQRNHLKRKQSKGDLLGRARGIESARSSEATEGLRTAPTAASELIQKHPGGRPSLLQDEGLKRLLIGILRSGATYRTACLVAGLNERTFENWRARAAIYDGDAIEDVPDEEREYVEFVRVATKARQEALLLYINVIRNAAIGRPGKSTMDPDGKYIVVEKELDPDPRAAARMLEWMDPEEYGRKYTIKTEQKERVVVEMQRVLDLALSSAGIDDEQRKLVGKFLLELSSQQRLE